jgi:hypothetical protein
MSTVLTIGRKQNHHLNNNGGSYNKSLHSDVDSLKSSLKQGDDSCDIYSNSDKSSTNNDTVNKGLKLQYQNS